MTGLNYWLKFVKKIVDRHASSKLINDSPFKYFDIRGRLVYNCSELCRSMWLIECMRVIWKPWPWFCLYEVLVIIGVRDSIYLNSALSMNLALLSIQWYVHVVGSTCIEYKKIHWKRPKTIRDWNLEFQTKYRSSVFPGLWVASFTCCVKSKLLRQSIVLESEQSFTSKLKSPSKITLSYLTRATDDNSLSNVLWGSING